jgi:hypothetical protein
MTTTAFGVVSKPVTNSELLFSMSPLVNRADVDAPLPPFWIDALPYVISMRGSSLGTRLYSLPNFLHDRFPHGSSTTIIFDSSYPSEFDQIEDLSEESLPLIAHRRYQISATLNFRGPAATSLLGGEDILEE